MKNKSVAWAKKINTMDNSQYSKRSVQQIMRNAISKAGLPVKGSCHVFRRSSATWKIENGWSLKHIAASLITRTTKQSKQTKQWITVQ